MHPKIVPGSCSELGASTHGNCNRYSRTRSEVNNRRRKRRRPQRTSTPVERIEDRTEYNDTWEKWEVSVNEFFYQSWKNELNLDLSERVECIYQPPETVNFIQNFNYYIFNSNYLPIWYQHEVIPINVFSPYFTSYAGFIIYCPTVGYRADGTYGVLPDFWYCYL